MKKYAFILMLILGSISVLCQTDKLLAFVDKSNAETENINQEREIRKPANQVKSLARNLPVTHTVKASTEVHSFLSSQNNRHDPVLTNPTTDALTFHSPAPTGCEDHLALQDKAIGIGDSFAYQVNNTLTVAGNNTTTVIEGNGVDGGSLVLTAGEFIDLLPGFTAEPGSELDASIQECSGNTSSIENPVSEDDNSQTPIINVYPNPNKGQFNIDIQSRHFSENDRLYFTVTDLLGKSYLTQFVRNQNSFKINLSNLIAGIYVLNFYSDKTLVETQKIVIK